MNKKLLNQIYNIIFYSFAICSAGYFIISSIQKNEGLKSSDIMYIIFLDVCHALYDAHLVAR